MMAVSNVQKQIRKPNNLTCLYRPRYNKIDFIRLLVPDLTRPPTFKSRDQFIYNIFVISYYDYLTE